MKKIKVFVSMLAAAAVLLLFPTNTALTAEAATPVTYTVKYMESESDWRYQSNTSTFDEGSYHRELYYLRQELKPGDYVVVYNDATCSVPAMDLGTVALGNLTVVSAKSNTVIFSGDIAEFYALADTQIALNANATRADVYDGLTINFNKNVGTLNFYHEDSVNSVIGVNGTVGELWGHDTSDNSTTYHYYNFQANTLRFYNNGFQTPAQYYSATPVATQRPATPGSNAGSTNNGEYDDVPKTGENPMIFWLVCGAILCACGSRFFAKKAR